MKLLKKKILFTLAHTGGVLQGRTDFEYFGLPEIYWRVPGYATSSVRDALGAMLKRRLVAKMDRDGKVFYRLTSIGREYAYDFLNIPRERAKLWDKGWRVVVMDAGTLPTKEVRLLRQQLVKLGLKSLSRGIWVTPVDKSERIKRLLIDIDMVQGVILMVTRRFMVGDDRSFAEKVWKLGKTNAAYQVLISRMQRLLRGVRSAKKMDVKLKREFVSVFDRWYELLPDEPRLPRALIPENWAFGEVESEFNKLAESVLELEREAAES